MHPCSTRCTGSALSTPHHATRQQSLAALLDRTLISGACHVARGHMQGDIIQRSDGWRERLVTPRTRTRPMLHLQHRNIATQNDGDRIVSIETPVLSQSVISPFVPCQPNTMPLISWALQCFVPGVSGLSPA